MRKDGSPCRSHLPRVKAFLSNEQGNYLLIRSFLSGDLWSLPGGHKNSISESDEECLIRKVKEELGSTFIKVDTLLFEDKYREQASSRIYLAHTQPQFKLATHKQLVHGVTWAPYKEFHRYRFTSLTDRVLKESEVSMCLTNPVEYCEGIRMAEKTS